MVIKYTKEELFKMDAVDVYKLVLKGNTIRKFPNGFWQQPEAKQNAIKCVKYMIENILNWSDEDIKDKLSLQTFYGNKLRGMIDGVFCNSPFKAIETAYPNRFKEWELQQVPNRFWNQETAVEAIKWLIEEKLNWSDEDIKTKLSIKVFSDNGLKGMLYRVFKNSPYKAIEAAYPNRFKEWELSKSPKNYWTLEKGIEATKWLIEDRLKWTEEDIRKKFGVRTLYDNGFRVLFEEVFDCSAYEILNMVYPNQFKEWELKRIPKDFWTVEKNIEATKWLVEEKLNWSDEDIKTKLSIKVFYDNGLKDMLRRLFDNSPYKAINVAYPNKFNKEDFKAKC